jgi:hypothetical protein
MVNCHNTNFDDLNYEGEKALKMWLDKHEMVEISESDIEEMAIDMLNDCYNKVEICGWKYEVGEILQKIDVCKFNDVVEEYADGKVEEGDWVCLGGSYYDLRDIKDNGDVELIMEQALREYFEELVIEELGG